MSDAKKCDICETLFEEERFERKVGESKDSMDLVMKVIIKRGWTSDHFIDVCDDCLEKKMKVFIKNEE